MIRFKKILISCVLGTAYIVRYNMVANDRVWNRKMIWKFMAFLSFSHDKIRIFIALSRGKSKVR